MRDLKFPPVSRQSSTPWRLRWVTLKNASSPSEHRTLYSVRSWLSYLWESYKESMNYRSNWWLHLIVIHHRKYSHLPCKLNPRHTRLSVCMSVTAILALQVKKAAYERTALHNSTHVQKSVLCRTLQTLTNLSLVHTYAFRSHARVTITQFPAKLASVVTGILCKWCLGL